MNYNDLVFDNLHIWHPYTSISNKLPSYPIVAAEGCELILSNGKRLIDGMSSWWSAIHGYNNPIINKAMKDQIDCMSHVMFGGITHPQAIKLCRKLLKLTPKKLECIFLSDSGSVAIEIAMKMALQYWQTKKEPRYKFLALKSSYHGDTLGAMSVCDSKIFMKNIYKNYIPQQEFIEFNNCNFYDIWDKNNDLNLFEYFSINHNILAAVIVEPIVQSAGGMNFYHPEYLRKIRNLCDKYEILLIADEIATGFGRTGKLFACNHADISPDILCLGKALTGGVLTLSATLTRRYIANTISNSEPGCFMHGSTFMGNPLACSAANANLSLLEDENWKIQVLKISKQLKNGLYPLINHKRVHDVRVLGAIGVVETTNIVNMKNLQDWFVNYGVWIRPFRKLIYLIPPYIISSSELSKLIDAISYSLDKKTNFLL